MKKEHREVKRTRIYTPDNLYLYVIECSCGEECKGWTMEDAEEMFFKHRREIEAKNINLNKDLLLLDNVQFIYELSLARLELRALGVNFEETDKVREFKVLNQSKELKELVKVIKRKTKNA